MDSVLLLLALAFAPGVYLAIIIYGKDKVEPEPKLILLKAFLLGAISIVPAWFIETYLTKKLDFEELGIWNAVISAFFVIALTEELGKFLMVRFHAYRLNDFNEPFDGIIYTVFVGLGFATAENVGYVLNHGFQIGVVRMFTAVPAHYAFAVIMGYYVGKAKFEPENRLMHMIKAVLFATLLHGAYDFFIIQQNYPALGFLTLGVLFMSIRISRKAIAELQSDSIFRFNNRILKVEPSTDEIKEP